MNSVLTYFIYVTDVINNNYCRHFQVLHGDTSSFHLLLPAIIIV